MFLTVAPVPPKVVRCLPLFLTVVGEVNRGSSVLIMPVAPRNVVNVLCVVCGLCGLVAHMSGINLGVSLRWAGPELPSPSSVTLPVPVVVLVVVTGPGVETLI